jgi:hypothetical protein
MDYPFVWWNIGGASGRINTDDLIRREGCILTKQGILTCGLSSYVSSDEGVVNTPRILNKASISFLPQDLCYYRQI